jgi:hypothetical protein
MRLNQIRVMAILGVVSMLMTSCDGGSYMVIPMWVVVLVLVCFVCR